MSMIGSERYAEAMKIAPGQQRFRGAFTKKPSMELMSIYSLDHLTYIAYRPRCYYIKYTGPCSDRIQPQHMCPSASRPKLTRCRSMT
jgi:hypothetical protein